MQFIASKILSFLYQPFNWILILCVLAFLCKKLTLRKKYLVAAFVVFILFSNKFIFNTICRLYQPAAVNINALPKFKVGILLGGLAAYDKNEVGFFNNASDRFIQTLQLYKLGKIKKIIISGGSSKILTKEKDEASFLYQSFLNCGVDSADLLIESKARNTEENMIYSKLLLDSLGIKNDVLIVTSAYHAPRTHYIAKKLGVSNYLVFPSNYTEINSILYPKDYLIPNDKTLYDWSFIIKEWVGLIVYKLKNN